MLRDSRFIVLLRIIATLIPALRYKVKGVARLALYLSIGISLRARKENAMFRYKTSRLAGAFLGGLLIGPAASFVPAYAQQPAATAPAAAMDKVEVRVNGRACPFCAYGFEKKLREEGEGHAVHA